MFQIIPWLCVILLSCIIYEWYRRLPRLRDLERKYVFVTGCDTGFGNILVRKLDLLGFQVIAGCLNEESREQLRIECSNRVRSLRLDISDHKSVRDAFEQCCNIIPSWEGLWGLVNNAGIPGISAGPLEWLETEDFRRVLEVNTLGLIDVTLTFLPLLKQKRGRIVNMSSAGRGRLAGPLALPYDISKCAVKCFSDGLRRHLSVYETGVTVHVIEPGLFKTEMLNPVKQRSIFDSTWRRLPQKTRDEYGDSFFTAYTSRSLDVMNRMASPDINKVTDAYVHALAAVHPKSRYTVGYDAIFFSLPISFLPSSFIDWIMYVVHPKLAMAFNR